MNRAKGLGTPEPAFQQVQKTFADHLREPQRAAAPQGIEDRRMKIYRDLIFNNIESFIASGFPVIRSLYRDDDWTELVRGFVGKHRAQSPYFLEISQEFLQYLQSEYVPRDCDPDFLLELAHYEWVELALDVSNENFPERRIEAGVLEGCPQVSPLVWSLSYRYPVHMIGPQFRPQEPPAEPTFLLVYRDRQEEVGFMQVNAVTARLLQILQDAEEPLTGRGALEVLAQEMGQADAAGLLSFGEDLLNKLLSRDILAAVLKPASG
ncbi:HvfC family RiPP maturation protein [Biformimicrobium ophioploci]|uniref:DUF2063 domain-containing protein n=1 Tax=Biformimicrobium ophioploci TaxID=3036711 RepID=A0ABQ6LYX4_9GAMM|nr:putative DNA-binding domain-containing protein [Microbulbifer sp. NKW57]GMG87296.1 DUF2063 domain-containing protein [Microbulbifer sp. NKW57]